MRTQMTEKEKELIQIIRSSEDPEQALITAVEIIVKFLQQGESSQERNLDGLREPA